MNKKENIKNNDHKETEFEAMTHFDNPHITHICDIQSHSFGTETIRDMATYIEFACTNKEIDFNDRQEIAKTLCVLGYRKIEDDEIVLKKSEYKELKKYRTDWLNDEKMHLQAELEDTEFELGCSNRLFQKVCKEKKELEEQLERAKKEAAREILKDIEFYGIRSLNDKIWKNHFKLTDYTMLYLKMKYGIEMEDNNEQR